MSLGSEPEQRVGIASTTRYEWILADLAVTLAGAATTTVYPTTNAADTAYILGDSESRVVFAEDDGQIAKLVEHRNELPHLMKIVTSDAKSDGDWIISLADLEKLGADKMAPNADAQVAHAEEIRADQLAALRSPLGTPGRRKGGRLQ